METKSVGIQIYGRGKPYPAAKLLSHPKESP
jgi:hypothetical protein